MPKVRSRRFISRAHTMSVKPVDRAFAIQDNAVRHIDVGTLKDVSAQEVLDSINESASRPEQVPNTKKERRMLKHELFLERLEASRAPYSKSHARRLKRKEREQLAGDLGSLRAALPSMTPTVASGSTSSAVGGETSAGAVIDAAATVSSTARASAGGASAKFIARSKLTTSINIPDLEEARQPTPRRPGMIGEGKGKSLTGSQRRYALKAERFRQPLIRSNPEFAANPFETIRTHARNTLVAHHATIQQRKQ
ncbi:ribosome biogenesis protein SLX9-domain-containing protein [Russula dissimulans]|nr:ribosome biogenesis protein SLX9-domain-containing protein [Russula dissimulans]